MTGIRRMVGGLLLGMALHTSAMAGSIILANDEWTLSDAGFSNAGTSAENFARNVASFFTGGGTGNFLVYSTNFGLTGSRLRQVMTDAGHGWTVSMGVTFDLATLSTYDAVFLAGNPADNDVLIDYVTAGGNVYLAGGTAYGGLDSSGEAAIWNVFLNHFGLGLYGTSYNSITGNIPIASSHELFDGVSVLYQRYGSTVLDTDPADPKGQVLVSYHGNGLYAVYDDRPAAVPEPTLPALLLTGLIAGALKGRRKESRPAHG